MADLQELLDVDAAACKLEAGDLSAVFLPSRGMLGASLCHKGEELLGRVDEIDAYARSGRTCGIPLLHPWANRLSDTRYLAAGQEVSLDASAALIGHDSAGLPMHGVPWSRLSWQVTGQDAGRLNAQLEWTKRELLAVFPFRHRLELAVTLRPSELTIETALIADAHGPVPVSFGFHPYFRIPGVPRAEWQVTIPPLQRLLLDERQIPTGQVMPFAALDTSLGKRTFDDGFALIEEQAAFSVAGRRRRITVEFLEGYRYAQVFAPDGQDYLAIEPMTAPANALVSTSGLRLIPPGQTFRATFRVSVGSAP